MRETFGKKFTPKSGAHGLASDNSPQSQRPSAYTTVPSSTRMTHNLHRSRHGAVQKVSSVGQHTHKRCVLASICGDNPLLYRPKWGTNLQKIKRRLRRKQPVCVHRTGRREEQKHPICLCLTARRQVGVIRKNSSQTKVKNMRTGRGYALILKFSVNLSRQKRFSVFLRTISIVERSKSVSKR